MSRQKTTVRFVVTCACLTAALAATLAADGWFASGSADASLHVEEDTALSDLDPINVQAVLPSMGDDLKVTSIVQRYPFDPRRLGMKRATGRGAARFNCFDANGNLRNFGSQNRKFDRYGNRVAIRKFPGAANCRSFSTTWSFSGAQQQPGDTSVNVKTGAQRIVAGADADCFDRNVLCLGRDNRFKVEVDWATFNRSGPSVPVVTGLFSGVFYFLDPNNTQAIVRLLDGCDFNDHFWVFAAAATDVSYDLTVTDTDTGEIKTYSNPLGTRAPTITDTTAFATCP